MKEKSVLVGISGGLDSAVAACLLIKQGLHVEGLYIDNGYPTRAESEAEVVCEKIGIALHKLTVAPDFENQVVEYFIAEYGAGRTPNPCAVCNKNIKFAYLLKEAGRRGLSFIATGHYSRIEYGRESGIFSLLRGRDLKKDQSYFLFRLGQEELSRLLFPNGGLTKDEVREISVAEKLKLETKRESQEICFIPGDDYRRFIESSPAASAFKPGDIVNGDGIVVGRHRGIHSVTVGQRKGLNIASERPYYVLSIDKEHNRIVVGREEDQFCTGLAASQVSWLDPAFEHTGPVRAVTRIRYRHRGVASTIVPDACGRSRVLVTFDSPQRAVTPGQAAVFYEGDRVLGGGWIEEGLRHG